VEALRHNPPPGATLRLSEDERARLPELLTQGSQAHGFRGEVWTCERVAIVIRREFGVSYRPSHVSRAMRSVFRGLPWQEGRFCLYEDHRLHYQKALLRRLQRPLKLTNTSSTARGPNE
jgi:transposase